MALTLLIPVTGYTCPGYCRAICLHVFNNIFTLSTDIHHLFLSWSSSSLYATILGRGGECVSMKMWVWIVILSICYVSMCYVMSGKYFLFVNEIPSLSPVFFIGAKLLRGVVTSHFLDCYFLQNLF